MSKQASIATRSSLFPTTAARLSAKRWSSDVYVPSNSGVIICFDVPDIDPVLERAVAQGAMILYPKKYIGAAGYVAEISDSEGNRIALTAVSD
jgi:predicted enzyme related to lactoylglutathione lyase